MLKTRKIEYYDQEVLLEGYVAVDDKTLEQKPVVLVAHDWSGCNQFAREKAEALAALGYIGFAIDMFGKGKLGETKEEKTNLIQPLMHDRSKLRRRIMAAYEIAKTLEDADAAQVGAMGFCFGGLCVLDLARSGAAVKGVVSFHGLLSAPENLFHAPIKAKVLALHGYADPMAPPEAVTAFANEMTAAKVDWQIHMYGNTLHAFTNPQANDSAFGTVYNALAAARSWTAMKDFFKEIFK